jgi:16S rRNA (adenine1518-N6/adenine1519-N6)-dimethyltransferase
MHVKPKKSLGQNFLIDKNIRRKIIEALELKPSDIVLEIGSGKGELTGLIAQSITKLYALEIDTALCDELNKNLKGYSNIEILNKDILKFDLKKYFSKPQYCKSRIKVFGNIPYYISSPIIEHLFKFKDIIDIIFITVQREFARRLTAIPGSKDYGSFSCFVQYYTQTKIILNIKKTCFLPSPKVDSCLVRLRIRTSPCVRIRDERLFFKIIRAAFNKRRKTLKNSLAGVIPLQKLEEFFKKYSIGRQTRPERLSLEDFAHLSDVA